MKGFVGKILRVNLTTRKTSIIETKKYEQWGGGHGIGSALFWDLCEDKTVSAFDPKNVVTLMTSPLCGTLVPAASARTEIQGIGCLSWPREWFTRSNVGGRFAPMLKFAGWDGIVIEGKASSPVWLDIRNQDVKIRDAKGLWGLNTYETQQEIWSDVLNGNAFGNWYQLDTGRDDGRTTERPAVLTIGPAGENLARVASIVHDAGNGAGQGGFGAVWGSKNLKAISVIGTGSVEVADPNALMQARIWLKENHAYNVDDPRHKVPVENPTFYGIINKFPGYGALNPFGEPSRAKGCVGCFVNCRRKTASGHGNESTCVEGLYFVSDDPAEINKSQDFPQIYGVNVYQLWTYNWLRDLYKMGVLGRNKQIHTELPFERFGTLEFAEQLYRAIAYREDIGDVLAEGMPRAAEKWGRLDDMNTGLLRYPNWGYTEHYDPRVEIEWSYGSILSDRDINEHDLNWVVYWMPTLRKMYNLEPVVSAEELVKRISSKFVIYDDPMMLDYSEKGIYSDAKVKMVSWHRYYTRFFKQSLGFCDWAWASFFNVNNPNLDGATPEGEPKFYNAVTGANITFEEGLEIGKKIWNLDRAIWILQGRHRDQEKFAGYVYNVPISVPYYLPVYENGEWKYGDNLGRKLDSDKFEDWKTRFYIHQGWDPKTGWPKRSTLEKMGLKFVADKLEEADKLRGE